jgi:hypothetical protein
MSRAQPQEPLPPIEASLEEIEIWLRDRLRSKRLYERLRSVHVRPTESHPCGWGASVRGEFTHVEQDACRATIAEMQRHFSLRA